MTPDFNRAGTPKDQQTFFAACTAGDVAAISTVITRWPDALGWIQGDDRKTGLMVAAENGHLGAAMAIVVAMQGSKFSIDQGNARGSTALMLCARAGHAKMMKLLLDFKALPNIQNQSGTTALMAAAWSGKREGCNLLIERGALVDTQDKEGMSALMYAATEDRNEVATALMDAGADKYLTNVDGQTASEIAESNDHRELAFRINHHVMPELVKPEEPPIAEVLEDFQKQANDVVRKIENPEPVPEKKSSVSSFAERLKKGGLI